MHQAGWAGCFGVAPRLGTLFVVLVRCTSLLRPAAGCPSHQLQPGKTGEGLLSSLCLRRWRCPRRETWSPLACARLTGCWPQVWGWLAASAPVWPARLPAICAQHAPKRAGLVTGLAEVPPIHCRGAGRGLSRGKGLARDIGGHRRVDRAGREGGGRPCPHGTTRDRCGGPSP